jgi:polysaccharide biosynthesis transport protein
MGVKPLGDAPNITARIYLSVVAMAVGHDNPSRPGHCDEWNDAHLRRPRIHRRLNLPNRQGLVDLFLQASHGLNGHVQRTSQLNLAALTTGALPPNPSELLGSAKMGEILAHLLQEADLLVVDSPPVLAVTDAAVLAPKMDAVILVVRPGETKLASARQAVDQLRCGGANLIGVVLNGIDLKRSRYFGYQYQAYYYIYNSRYAKEEEKRVKEPAA